MKLNGWNRIGIILSVIWLGYLGHMFYEERTSIPTFEASFHGLCANPRGYFYYWADSNSGQALETLSKSDQLTCDGAQLIADELINKSESGEISPIIKTDYQNLMEFIFLPLALFWLAYIVIQVIVRWVARGFGGGQKIV